MKPGPNVWLEGDFRESGKSRSLVGAIRRGITVPSDDPGFASGAIQIRAPIVILGLEGHKRAGNEGIATSMFRHIKSRGEMLLRKEK